MANSMPDPSASDSTSRSLIVRLQDNEVPAWRELVKLYSPLIHYWCRRQGLDDADCADMTQEVFRSVVSGIGNFTKRKASDTFRGWLRTVTLNKIRDHFRKNQKQVSAQGGSVARSGLATATAEDDFPDRDEDELRQEHALFVRAISLIKKDFTEQTWNAFWLVTVDELSAAEAGRTLGMTSSAVRVAKSRVLKRLRNQLGDNPA